MEETIKKKKSVAALIIVGVIMIIAIGVIVALVIKTGSSEYKLKKQLEIADKYLAELNYEQAIVAYKDAITIDPRSNVAYEGMTDAYLAWAESMLSEGRVDEAKQLLKQALDELQILEQNGSDHELIARQSLRIEQKLEEIVGEDQKKEEEKEEIQIDIEQDVLAEMTEELIDIQEDYRENVRNLTSRRDREEQYRYFLKEFEAYIEEYEKTYGTGDCTCGQLEVNGFSRNDKNYFELGEAYDYVVSFYLLLDDEDTAWAVRSRQAKNAGMEILLDGFKGFIAGDGEESSVSYYDMSGQGIEVKHPSWGGSVNATSTYDRFGRTVAEDSDDGWHYEYVYGPNNRIEKTYSGDSREGHWLSWIYDDQGNYIESVLED